MFLIDGKAIAKKITETLRASIENLVERKPGLAVLLIGDNPASCAYVKMKKKACAEVGIHSVVQHLPAAISQEFLLEKIKELNQDPTIDGILVQLPLPPHIDADLITASIAPSKDVDGLHPHNMGKLLLGQEGGFAPCTPSGIKILLIESGIKIDGKHVVIVGRSNLVGKPLAAILVQKNPSCNATVTLAHSATPNLADICLQADILVAAIGKPLFITSSMVKQGAVVVDVGINRVASAAGYALVGDVDFENVAPKCSAITPVPGGVGPMTIAQLLSNTWLSYQRSCL
jgi:methylenetetrahydrofolate dehydrogenase (NADP+)/methenyltetrahydrofolate cyclohydrolase